MDGRPSGSQGREVAQLAQACRRPRQRSARRPSSQSRRALACSNENGPPLNENARSLAASGVSSLTEPYSLAVLRALRRCLRSGLRLASSPASNQLCSRPSWTRLSSSPRLPALRRCLRLSPRHRPCLDLVSSSRLLQYIRPEPATSYRLSILWPPSRLESASALRPRLSRLFGLALSSSSRNAPAGFALRLNFSCRFQPCGPPRSLPLNPPAAFRLRRLTLSFKPLVSCHSFRPAFWPASLRRSGSRPCAFVLKRPSGMPLVRRLSRLAPAAPSDPRAGFQDLRPFPQPSGYRPLACASADCSGLAAFASCGCQLPTACGPPGSRSSQNLRPAQIRPVACSRLRLACASRRSGAGLSVLPRRPRYR